MDCCLAVLLCYYVRIESGPGEVGGCVPESAGEDTRTRDQDGGRENQNGTGLSAFYVCTKQLIRNVSGVSSCYK